MKTLLALAVLVVAVPVSWGIAAEGGLSVPLLSIHDGRPVGVIVLSDSPKLTATGEPIGEPR